MLSMMNMFQMNRRKEKICCTRVESILLWISATVKNNTTFQEMWQSAL